MNVSQAGPLELMETQQVVLVGVLVLLEVQQGPRKQPQGPLPLWSALQTGRGKCRRHQTAGRLARAHLQGEQQQGAHPQG